jgi:hypothetical protein
MLLFETTGRAVAAAMVFACLSACTSTEDVVMALEDTLAMENEAFVKAIRTCQWGPEEPIEAQRARYLAEWDSAAADNIANIAPDQEWEIRKALGKEMGLAPSEVNGWKQIYESRAESAKRTLAKIESEKEAKAVADELQKKEACARSDELRKSIADTKAKLEEFKADL